jgi:murein DD-endopeptidase MepM/ murein hydrolase activator NlpD
MQKLTVIILALVAISCNSLHSLKTAFVKVSPYEHYVQSLEKADLHTTPMAKAWIDAGRKALNDSLYITLPFTEAGAFQSSVPEARSYNFSVRDGQVLQVTGAMRATPHARMFVDLFVQKDTAWVPLTHADSAFQLTHEFEQNYQCLLRIQPELLSSAYYTITLSLTPVLINPVRGASNKSIGSFYGDNRDGGQRKHEGVDIFAPKGTPVVAPAAGHVTRVGTSNLGGKVVWMQDAQRSHSYYFAHLDQQLVTVGKKVKQGDTLGLVGNTGNARTTPAHLHFGIYQTRSKDPLNYILTLESLENSPLDTAFQLQAYRVQTKTANLRTGPNEKQPLKEKLLRDTYVQILAQSKDWYRVALPDNRQGFLQKGTIIPADKGKLFKLKTQATLLSESNENSIPRAYLQKATLVERLAYYKNFEYVRTPSGATGWLMIL